MATDETTAAPGDTVGGETTRSPDSEPDNDSVIAMVQVVNVTGFLLAAVILFSLAIHPQTSDAGLAFLTWLLVFGTAAIVAEHRMLLAARHVLAGVSLAELFTRRGRRRLRRDPSAYFGEAEYRRYRSRRRALLMTALAGIVALVAVSVGTLVDDVRDVSEAIAADGVDR